MYNCDDKSCLHIFHFISQEIIIIARFLLHSCSYIPTKFSADLKRLAALNCDRASSFTNRYLPMHDRKVLPGVPPPGTSFLSFAFLVFEFPVSLCAFVYIQFRVQEQCVSRVSLFNDLFSWCSILLFAMNHNIFHTFSSRRLMEQASLQREESPRALPV